MKKISLGILALLFVPFSLAFVTTSNGTISVNLTAPANQSLIIASSNESTSVDIACMLPPAQNATNTTPVNSTGVCDVTRTMTAGETFIRQDASCNLRFTCPEQVRVIDPGNVTAYARFKVTKNASIINISNDFDNKSRVFNMDDVTSFETEFSFLCPAGAKESGSQFTPFNLSDEQFSYYCLEPFGRYTKALTELSMQNTNNTLSTIERLAENQGVIKQLSEENGRLAAENDGLRQNKADYENAVLKLKEQGRELDECRRATEKEGVKTFWLIIGYGGIILGGSFLLLRRFVKKQRKMYLGGDY